MPRRRKHEPVAASIREECVKADEEVRKISAQTRCPVRTDTMRNKNCTVRSLPGQQATKGHRWMAYLMLLGSTG